MIHRKKIVKLPTLLSSRIFIKGFNMFIDGEDISRPYWSWRKFGYPSEQFCDWSLWLQPDQLRLISRSNNCCHFSSCSNIPIAQFDFFSWTMSCSRHIHNNSAERERERINCFPTKRMSAMVALIQSREQASSIINYCNRTRRMSYESLGQRGGSESWQTRKVIKDSKTKPSPARYMFQHNCYCLVCFSSFCLSCPLSAAACSNIFLYSKCSCKRFDRVSWPARACWRFQRSFWDFVINFFFSLSLTKG